MAPPTFSIDDSNETNLGVPIYGMKLDGNPFNKHALNGHEAGTNGHTTDPSISNGTSHNAQNGCADGTPPPIAICGMACRLPGGVSTPQDLWSFLLARKSARGRVPRSRYNIDSYYSPVLKPGTVSTEYGYFLDDSVDLGALDTSFFSLPRTEVERADPQQRLMLEVARECFEDAGLTNWRGKTIGCYIGNFGEDWVEMFAKETQQWGMHRIVGTGDFVISNRLSYEFDIRGPSMTIRTGCSAALVCLNEACAAIARGDCEGALIGGVNVILAPSMTAAMTEQGILSPDGICKSFSAEANGYARGEAATAIYIKPLAHALRDGNPVRAVVRATSHNVDGKTPGLSQPSTDAQEALIRRAYQLGGITDYGQTAMVECHGTGTPTGDPIEAKAVARVFGEKGVYIGSVKPSMGHTEGASGLVSLIKMVMALEHRTIPPNIHFKTPNPNIPFEDAKLIVPLEPTAWPQDRLERISLNSFGVGGANAHVILESAAAFHAAPSAVPQAISQAPQLLLFTGNSAKSLTKLIENYKNWVETNPNKVEDLAYTLACRREHLPHRAFAIVTAGVIDSISQPSNSKFEQKPSIVMVFTGQGAQWPRMGHELLQSNEVFKSTITSLDRDLQRMSGGGRPAQYSIIEELENPPKTSRLGSAEISQPLCTAVQIALIDVLRSLAIVPDAVVGHSSGEIAAAYASGALTATEAIIAAHYRGAITAEQIRPGSMAAISMSWANTERYLVPGAILACDNSPNSVTISGDVDAIDGVIAAVKQEHPDVMARLLQVNKAYHSYHMWEIGDRYRDQIGHIAAKAPSVPFFSSVTGKLLDKERILGASYWQENLESPVRFREAITSILSHEVGKNAIFLELGPHSALAGPLRQICMTSSVPSPYVSVMTRNRNSVGTLLTAVGKLHSLNVSINLSTLFKTGTCLPDLPRYPWNHEDSYWYEPRISKEWRERRFPYHDLLGVKVPESTDIEPIWRNQFHLANVPWVRDHKVGEDIVFPFAGYIVLAGEAIRQTTQIDEGFSVRNIAVTMALVLPEGKPTEMVTSFRPHRLTDSLNSSWWEFTVTSYNGHVWTKHCRGEVSAISSGPEADHIAENLARKVNPSRWYGSMRRKGLNLGPCFQALEAIGTSTDSSNLAIGTATNGRQGDEGNYHIHPTALDGMIQLLGAAAINGCTYKNENWLPTSIEEFTVYRCSSNLICRVHASLSSNHSIIGGGYCTSEGKRVVAASGMTMSLAEGALSEEVADTHAAARYEWSPDPDFMAIGELIRPPTSRADVLPLLDELGQLCILSSQRRLSVSDPRLPHLKKYKAWLDSEAPPAVAKLASTAKSLDNTIIAARAQELIETLSHTSAAVAANAIHEVHTKIDQLWSSQQSPEDILTDETLKLLYGFLSDFDRSRFIQSLGHLKPNLQILEIGGGRGPLAENVIKYLTRPNGQVLCSKYTLTSKGFVSKKDQKQWFSDMEYITLDISQDPAEQGFVDHAYDLIISTPGASHRDVNNQKTLENLKKLLRIDGRLLLHEICPSSKWVSYVLGILPSWWSDNTTENTEGPYLGTERLKSILYDAGFGEAKDIVMDAEGPHHLTAAMVVRPQSPRRTIAKKVTVLYEKCGVVVDSIVNHLEAEGYEVAKCTLKDGGVANQDVISLLDAEGPFFAMAEEPGFQLFKRFVLGLQNAGVLWVTRSCAVHSRDPRYAQVLGLARVIRSEMLADFATCEVDQFNSSASIVRVLEKFRGRQGDDTLNPDYEWAIRDGQILVGRFYPFPLRDELLATDNDENAILDVEKPGRINSLRWVQQPRETPEANEVEVQVHSAGLNFRDILVALGIVELPIRQFGLEAAGIITRVGADVNPDELKVGDRVCCLKKQAYSTYITTPTIFCTRIPDSLHFDEAASMLMPYVTAIHGLVNVGRLVKDQSVLIHSACGGVGLAAIQISKMLEANIFATVGSEEKVRFLMENFGIPRSHIFNSRDKSFVQSVMRETKGQGIDIILNSLSGELLHETWKCVAEFGTLVEIGKRDLIGNGKLDLRPFLGNRSYCCIDIDQLWKKPVLLRNLILSTLEFCEKGYTTPVRPIKVFPASQTQDAFRFMQKGQHIGRVGISIAHHPAAADATFEPIKRMRPATFDGHASYLLVGGLGGLGRSIATWMIESGAREIIFLSRSAGTNPKDGPFVTELQSMGCHVKLVKGDVAVLDDVARSVSAATLPLKGVVQMSMVLRDQNFTNMTYDEWEAVTAPKVLGTWNLHDATVSARADLDFFVLFSSLSGIIGQPGQANYASGNSFLDAFCQYRNAMGLAASAVDIGAVEDIGFISENGGLMNRMKTAGFKAVKERELLEAMAIATMARTKPPYIEPGSHSFVHPNTFVLGLGSSTSLTNPKNRVLWKKDRRMAAYHRVASRESDPALSNEILKSFLSSAMADPSILKTVDSATLLALEIGKKLFDLLLKPQEELNTSWPLVDLGLDSLVALELRAWWKQVFSFDITVLEMLGMGSLDALGRHAADGLLASYTQEDDKGQ